MGAAYVTGFCPEQDKSTVWQLFQEEQEQDRYENGHCYSGGIGMAEGIRFLDDKKFGSVEEAEDWVVDQAQKWGPALAVRVIHPDQSKCGWYYGAWCAE